jgi:hypothetical protein
MGSICLFETPVGFQRTIDCYVTGNREHLFSHLHIILEAAVALSV